MRARLALLSLSIAALVSAAPAVAGADPTFPPSIQAKLGLSYTPPCNICHTSAAGFPAPASQPFALAMKSNGLVAPDPGGRLDAALAALAAAQTDSDCDGVPDITQLKDGRDPNPPGEYLDGSGKTPPTDPGCADAEPVVYGCGAQLSRAPAPWQGAALLVAGLGAALVRRRRRCSAAAGGLVPASPWTPSPP